MEEGKNKASLINESHKREEVAFWDNLEGDLPKKEKAVNNNVAKNNVAKNTAKKVVEIKVIPNLVQIRETSEEDKEERTSVYMRPSYMDDIKDFQHEYWKKYKTKIPIRTVLEMGIELVKLKLKEDGN